MSTGDRAPDVKPLHTVALGSSFAAGPRIPPQVNRAAGRSGQNYAHILADRLGARLTDLTVSGATLQTVLSEPQVTSRARFEPQLANFPPEADIVTITAGGNDLNYIGGIVQDTIRAYFLGRLLLRFLPIPEQKESLTAEDLAQRFIAVIDKIRETSPSSRILLVEYLTLFGNQTRPGVDVWLNDPQIKRHQEVASTLQTAYRLAAEARSGCEVIPIAESSRDHGIGSDEPWVEGFSIPMLFTGAAPFHPNANGMQAVADTLCSHLSETSPS